MKKKIMCLAMSVAVAATVFSGCGSSDSAQETTSKTESQSESVQDESVQAESAQADSESDEAEEGYTFTVSIDRNEQGLIIDETVTEVPTHVVCSGFQMAGMLCDLGQEDKIVGVLTSRPESWNTSYAPGVSEKLGQLEVLGTANDVSKEQILALECDFLMGWDSTFSDKRYDVDFCQSNDIIMYPPYCTYDSAASMDDIYKDYETLGHIFDCEEVAQEKIAEMKKVVAEVEEVLKDVEEPITILNYDSGEDDVFTACQGMPGAIFKYAGGISIFDDIEKGWARVSWEEIVDRNPSVIIINNYSGTEEEAQSSCDFLLSVSAIKDIDAIKNDKIYAVNLDDMEGSAGTAYLIKELAQILYPEKF
ncbi:MAG: ABC transporter substrate-binding protein [Lachnospiraceae bacterium]|nr:ABC transporter substrate-binding protein [Lachnospiraceae bacterium]